MQKNRNKYNKNNNNIFNNNIFNKKIKKIKNKIYNNYKLIIKQMKIIYKKNK